MESGEGSRPLSAKALRALLRTSGAGAPKHAEELRPLDLVKLTLPAPLRRTTAAGEIDVPPPRRCPRNAEPTWQIPRSGRFSPADVVRRLFGSRR